VLDTIGLTYLRLGKLQQAQDHIEAALDTLCKMLGNDHPSTAAALINLAGVHSKLGDHAKAVALKTQALRICNHVFGESHPMTATALNNVGGAYRDLGDHEKALEFARRSLDVRRSVLGDDHPDSGSSFANVSEVETSLGHHRIALECARCALDILIKALGPAHSRTLATVLVVVGKWVNFNRPDSAYRLLESWLKKLPLDHPRRAAFIVRLHGLPIPAGRRRPPSTSKRSRKRS